jgi:hypothetical protein
MATPDPRTSSAMLNGKLVRMNKKVEGAVLTSVTTEGATLEWHGEKKFLEIGSGTRD